MAKFDYPVHPVSELFPSMDAESFTALKADIAAHGQSEPIVLWKKQLIDGRHRLKACNELGIKPIVVDISNSDDPLVYVLSHNLHRRHLTESQRAMVAAKIATLKHGEVGNGRKVDAQICAPTTTDAASTLNVSRRSVQNAKQVLEQGSKAVQKAVEQGNLAVSAAAALATSGATKTEQTEAIKGGKEAVKKVIKKPAAKPPKDKPVKTVKEQVALLKTLIKNHNAAMMRAVGDLHAISPNKSSNDAILKLFRSIHDAIEGWQ